LSTQPTLNKAAIDCRASLLAPITDTETVTVQTLGDDFNRGSRSKIKIRWFSSHLLLMQY